MAIAHPSFLPAVVAIIAVLVEVISSEAVQTAVIAVGAYVIFDLHHSQYLQWPGTFHDGQGLVDDYYTHALGEGTWGAGLTLDEFKDKCRGVLEDPLSQKYVKNAGGGNAYFMGYDPVSGIMAIVDRLGEITHCQKRNAPNLDKLLKNEGWKPIKTMPAFYGVI